MTVISKIKKRLYFVVAGYFRFFANLSFKRWNPRVIAITGSVGKTTMLHLLECKLGVKAHYSHNANSAFGIAFDLVNLRGVTGSKLRWLYLIFAVPIKSLFYKHDEKFYVVEIDGERPRETEFLAKWLRPEVTLWISLGRSHAIQFEQQVESGEFENLDKAIAHEFAFLPQYTKKRIYIDADSTLMIKATGKIKEKHRIPAEVIKCSKDLLRKYIVYPDKTKFIFDDVEYLFNHPLPRDLAIQLAMLNELSKYLKLSLKSNFSDLKNPPGRSSFFPGKNGLKLIDSSYNAHLISVASILDMVKSMRADHKWLVIGDIVDQGKIEGEEHTKLAELIQKVGPEQVVLVGRRTAKYTAPKLIKAGIKTFATNDLHAALVFIEKNTTGQETLVFKGSQYLEWLIEKLLLNPEDVQKLPRREKAAIKRRIKRGLR